MCVVEVSGVLGFVLHLSRVTGISLIRLKRCENGYDASYSFGTALYGYFGVTLSNLLGVIGFVLQVLFNNSFPTANTLNITTTIIMCALFWCNAKAKTKLMLKHLAILNKINSKLSCSIIKPRMLEKKHLALHIGGSVFYFSLTSLSFIKSVLIAENLPDYIYLSLIYPNVQIFMLETLMTMLKYEVYETLKGLTGELGKHLGRMKFDQPTVDSTPICIRNIGNAYFSVCKVVAEMNERDGKMCIFLITSLVFYTVHATCDLIYRITSDSKVVLICLFASKNTFDIVYDLLWISLFVIRLYVIVEPCHYITEEAGKIQIILSKLMCHTTAVGKPCSWEWDLILHQLYLLEPTFTPFGMITLDRTLLTSIISVTTTYLAIAIPHTKTLYKNMTFI